MYVDFSNELEEKHFVKFFILFMKYNVIWLKGNSNIRPETDFRLLQFISQNGENARNGNLDSWFPNII